MRDSIQWETKMALVNTHTLMVPPMRVNGRMVSFKESASICGQMAKNTTDNGLRTTCMDTAFTHTQMVSNTRVSLLKD